MILPYMATALLSIGIDQYTNSLSQSGVQYSKTPTKNQHIKIEILHTWVGGWSSLP